MAPCWSVADSHLPRHGRAGDGLSGRRAALVSPPRRAVAPADLRRLRALLPAASPGGPAASWPAASASARGGGQRRGAASTPARRAVAALTFRNIAGHVPVE